MNAITPPLAIVEAGITPNRSNHYAGMSAMTSTAIQARGVKVLWECDLPGDWRGSEHEPALVPNVTQRNGMVCDIALFSCMSDDVYCFDASNPDPATGRGRVIWQQRLGNPVNIAQYDANGVWKNPYDMFPINRPFWGGLSHPYIDLNTMTAYVCVASTPDGTMPRIRYYLHALNLMDGSARCPPLDISTAIYASPGGPIHHDASPRKQRSGLAFYSYNNGTYDVIFIADSTFAMMANAAHGFLVAVNVTKVRTGGAMQLDACTTMSAPPYAGAGLWMAGMAPALNEIGELFVVCANGAFDPSKGCYGNASVKVQFNPATATSPASFASQTHFAAYSDAGRTGKDPTIPWIGLIGNFTGQMDGASMTAPNDQDLGCAQGAYIPKSETGFTKNLFCPAGKDGIGYGLDADAMGDTQIADFAPDKIQANYAKALWITGATYYPGAFDITPTDLGMMSTTPDGYTHHQHSTPPWYMSPDHGLLIYYGGENGPVRVFQITQDPTTEKFSCTYLATGAEYASEGMAAPGGMPGTFMTISSNPTDPNSAALHCLMPWKGDANKAIVQGRYVIYAANWIDEKTGQLIKIFDSLTDTGVYWSHCKFGYARPGPRDRVWTPTYDAKCLIWGLA